MTITLRLATPRDHRACAEVFLRSRRAAFCWLPPERFQLEDYEPSVVDEEVWVAVQDEQVVGFASIFIEQDFLHNLFVEPSFQRQGVGKILLEKFLSRTQRPSLLKCLAANQNALSFYQKHSWEKLEEGEEEFGPYWVLIKR